MNPDSPSKGLLTSRVKSCALEMGFHQVGITEYKYLLDAEDRIKQWVAEGRHAGMRHLEDMRQRRVRFLSGFGEVRSVIVLGVNYYPGNPEPPEKAGQKALAGRVARYAWGKDYHRSVRQRHEDYIRRLHDILGHPFRTRSCVDTEPVSERSAAICAGLGFVGKHTILINRQFGPWMILSAILTDLELNFDLPETGCCGTCTACQEVCPTGALDQDYRIDAGRCIAYLTVEHRGVIPRPLRGKMKDWI